MKAKYTYILIAIITINSFSVFCQQQDSLKNRNKITSEDIRERFLNKYVDSLKNCQRKFPTTILKPSFDSRNYTKWRNNHRPECLRRVILKKIDDPSILLTIEAELRKIDKEKMIESSTPYSSFTFHDLVKIRIEELKNYE
jgi:hypothetical protein